MCIEDMKNVDVRTVDPEELVDVRDVVIDRALPKDERIRSFIEQIRNPYCFKCGEVVVKMSFLETEVTLEDRMESYLRSL